VTLPCSRYGKARKDRTIEDMTTVQGQGDGGAISGPKDSLTALLHLLQKQPSADLLFLMLVIMKDIQYKFVSFQDIENHYHFLFPYLFIKTALTHQMLSLCPSYNKSISLTSYKPGNR